MKPTLFVWWFRPAATPTRNELCSSWNSKPSTFGASTSESMIAKCTSGNFGATLPSAAAYAKPTAMIGL